MNDLAVGCLIVGGGLIVLWMFLIQIRLDSLSRKAKHLEERSQAQQDLWMEQLSINDGMIDKLEGQRGKKPWLGRN